MRLKVFGTGSKGNSYALISNSGEILLLECGIHVSKIKPYFDFDLTKVIGCLVTHRHGDHAKYINKFQDSGINVFANADTIHNLQLERVNLLEAQQSLTLAGFSIFPFELEHDVPCLGFIIDHAESGRILFITDTCYCPYQFESLNNIIVEANYCEDIITERAKNGANSYVIDRVVKSHMSIQTCKELLRSNDLSKVSNIVLIHLSDSNSHAESFEKQIIADTGIKTTVAFNNTEINFNKYGF